LSSKYFVTNLGGLQFNHKICLSLFIFHKVRLYLWYKIWKMMVWTPLYHLWWKDSIPPISISGEQLVHWEPDGYCRGGKL